MRALLKTYTSHCLQNCKTARAKRLSVLDVGEGRALPSKSSCFMGCALPDSQAQRRSGIGMEDLIWEFP